MMRIHEGLVGDPERNCDNYMWKLKPQIPNAAPKAGTEKPS
jgi:hypothetical protein